MHEIQFNINMVLCLFNSSSKIWDALLTLDEWIDLICKEYKYGLN
jgi:hypothetical protein